MNRPLARVLTRLAYVEPRRTCKCAILPYPWIERRLYSRAQNGSSTRRLLQSEELVQSQNQRQTIFALATPPGKAGVAIIRISGPLAASVYSRIVRTRGAKGKGKGKGKEVLGDDIVPERKMSRCWIIDPENGEPLDDGMCVFFKGPRSFTSEDTLELHIHSSRAVISAILSSLARIQGCRPADQGEFTRRAFESGRIDLTEVEGILDLVDAETETQRKLAIGAAAGRTRKRFEALREDTVRCLAMVEALIDFGEGEDIEEGVYEQARNKVRSLRDKVSKHLSDSRRGEILRSGIRLAIFGPPNAGKSSLLNYLAQREAAIVTPLPGTTRDVLEVSLNIGGMPVIVCDTAGLRKTEDVVERIGVEKAEQTIQEADVSLCVLSLEDLSSETIPHAIASRLDPSTLILLNKADLVPDAAFANRLLPENAKFWFASVKNESGMDTFLDGFVGELKARFEGGSQGEVEPLITHSRHRVHLQTALEFLDAFLATDDVVLGAEELRYAAQEIGKVSGRDIGVEDILDSLFREFCIGK